jgi:hypothetical protein
VYQETRLVLLSKAAAVYFHGSHASGQRTRIARQYDTSDCHHCMRCMSWAAQDPRHGSNNLKSGVLLAGGKVSKLREIHTCDFCASCLGDTETQDDDDVAMHRAWLHYHMASLLYDVKLEASGAWLASTEAVHQQHQARVADLKLGSTAGVDVGQDFVLLSPRDLHVLHKLLDSDIDEMQESKQQQRLRQARQKFITKWQQARRVAAGAVYGAHAW